MHISRNLATHAYDVSTAREIIEKIRMEYFCLFKELKARLEKEL
jgi:hypothetical protein